MKIPVFLLIWLFCDVSSFRNTRTFSTTLRYSQVKIFNIPTITLVPSSPTILHTQDHKLFEIDRTASEPQPRKYGVHVLLGGKVLNIWGLIYAFTTFFTAFTMFPLMLILTKVSDISGNGKLIFLFFAQRRRALDWVIHVWAKITMMLTTSQVKVYGAQYLPGVDETVVFIPNHTSYFDIPLLSGYIPRPFKYLSKAEIMNIPLVGYGMKLAKHVFLKRNDLKSAAEVHAKCVKRLRDGNSMLLFAEGRRSDDGCLHLFKKGAFQIAKEANVRIIPVSISNMHYWTPSSSILPIAPIRSTYVKIHPPIETTNKTVNELKNACFDAVNSGLPVYQQYKKPIGSSGGNSSGSYGENSDNSENK